MQITEVELYEQVGRLYMANVKLAQQLELEVRAKQTDTVSTSPNVDPANDES